MKIICIGRNYADHISELNNEKPEEPVIFMKADSSVLLKKFPFVIPEFTNDVHHEVELLVKINKVGKYISNLFEFRPAIILSAASCELIIIGIVKLFMSVIDVFTKPGFIILISIFSGDSA